MPTLEYLTLDSIRELPAPPAGNTVYWCAGALVQGREVPKGFGVRITANGARSFVLNYSLNGKEHRYTIGSVASWNVTEAVREARQLRQRIDKGDDPLAKPVRVEAKKTVGEILDLFLKRARLKRPDHYQDVFKRFVKPAFGTLPINELRRRHIVELLDKIEDNHGAVMATRALSYLRSALNWHAVRDDEFVPPFVKGMARSSTAERARDRILTDEEIRTLWPVLESNGNLGRACQVMLLTGSRRSEVTGMRWDEIVDGVWTIPASRYKTGKDHVVPLSGMALAIINGQNRLKPLVFPGRQGAVLSRGGQGKAKIDKATPGLVPWVLHDLRRTARSLMSRVGVRPDIAERVLGHAIVGQGQTYDRHSYLEEKRQALELLAETVRAIVDQERAIDKECNK
jgi:integrase